MKSAHTSTVRPVPPGFSPEGVARLDASLTERVARGELAGVVGAVSLGPEHQIVIARGHADRARGVAITPSTPVRVYSMSKPICAVLVLRLCELGLLTLDMEVALLIPALGRLQVLDARGESVPAQRALTIRHLLTHTAGFVYANPTGSLVERRAAEALGGAHGSEQDLTLEEYVTRLSAAPLAHEPGSAFSYGVSMDVLARLSEVATGLPFDVLLRREIFLPLGMNDTGFHPAPRRAATIYGRPRRDTDLVPIWTTALESASAPRFLSGGGGIVSTTADYLRFCEMLLADGARAGIRILSPESVHCLRSCHVPDGPSLVRAGPECGAGCGYGFGVRVVVREGADHGEPGAYGWDGLAGTTFLIDPQRGFCALLMTQVAPWPDGLHTEFRARAYESVMTQRS